ncbi:MAG: hypothetical protein RMJ98_10325, partial [Myxococcales bacterium]|nr:hypothetical protein [Polyangiaceae bacterium]MDW8249682.1 hypothetical protein [Myxococcales bacterium]
CPWMWSSEGNSPTFLNIPGWVRNPYFVNSLALALIALAGGAELKLEVLQAELRSISVGNALHVVIGAPAMALVFYLARPMIPFTQQLTSSALLGVAMLWGVIAIS